MDGGALVAQKAELEVIGGTPETRSFLSLISDYDFKIGIFELVDFWTNSDIIFDSGWTWSLIRPGSSSTWSMMPAAFRETTCACWRRIREVHRLRELDAQTVAVF